MVNRNQTKTIGIVSIVLFVFSLALFAGARYLVSTTEANLLAKQIEIAEVHTQSQELASLVRLVEESAIERDQLLSYIVQEEDVIDLLSLVETVVKEQGASVDISALTVLPVSGVFEKLSMKITIEGTYVSVLRVINVFENLPYQTSIRSVDLSAPDSAVSNAATAHIILEVTKQKDV